MSQIKEKLEFNPREQAMAKQIKDNILKQLEKIKIDSRVIAEVSCDEEGQVKWGNIYVDGRALSEEDERELWDIVHEVVEGFCGALGFPASLITIRPS